MSKRGIDLYAFLKGKIHDHYFSHDTIAEEGDYVKMKDVEDLFNKLRLEKKLLLRNQKIELLEKYSKFLEERRYMDTDWWSEEPFAIDEFLKENKL